MIEFMQNIWSWIVSNKEGIIAFVTSSNFVALVTLIITSIKQTLSSNKNSNCINNVTEALSDAKIQKSDVEAVKNNTAVTLNSIADCNDKIISVETKLNEFVNTTMEKLNSMIEVQSIVYSTIKDDSIRNAVNAVLVQAKYGSAKAKAELEKELEDIKAKFNEAVSLANNKVSQTVDKVKSTIEASSPTHVEQKEETKRTRY